LISESDYTDYSIFDQPIATLQSDDCSTQMYYYTCDNQMDIPSKIATAENKRPVAMLVSTTAGSLILYQWFLKGIQGIRHKKAFSAYSNFASSLWNDSKVQKSYNIITQ
jgi:hypothetical protein